jgi:ComF family protein
VAAYEGSLERSVHRFKYEGWRVLARPLATLLVDRLAVEGPPAALLAAVPLHPRRQKMRGYNQSELMARELARAFKLSPPVVGLRRVRDTPPQVGLDRIRRRENMAGAFAWARARLQGEPVLLIDDVATTGATLEACAGVLRAAGSGPVTGLVLARVRL